MVTKHIYTTQFIKTDFLLSAKIDIFVSTQTDLFQKSYYYDVHLQRLHQEVHLIQNATF